MAGYYGFMLDVRSPAHLTCVYQFIFSFPDDLSKYRRIFSKHGICIDIVDLSFFDKRYLAGTHPYFHSRTSKFQGIVTKLGMCIDVVKIWFGIVNGQISSILTVICL